MQINNSLEAIGWSPEWAAAFEVIAAGDGLVPARVAEEHRGELRVLWQGGELVAEVSGRLRYMAASAEEMPGVGDWVSVAPRAEEGRGTIHHVLTRRSALTRKVPDRPSEVQLLAANVDIVLIVSSANRDLNPRRIERALALVREGGAEPVIVLNKVDLADDVAAAVQIAQEAAAGCDVVALSALTQQGVGALSPYLVDGRTIALLGSSGVGKSTLVNCLLGRDRMETQPIRDDDDKGRHTTTHRQLVPLPGRGVLIDTPGLRELGLWGEEESIGSAFPEIEALLGSCRFHDCGHGNEPGCQIRAALDDGRIEAERWASYGKLVREVERLAARRSARAQHERRKETKKFSKMVRDLPNKRRPRS